MRWFKRNPNTAWLFRPKPDITTLELAGCVLLLLAEKDGTLKDAIKQSHDDVVRHWEKKER